MAEIVTTQPTAEFNKSTPSNDDYDMNFPPLAKRNNQDKLDIGHLSDKLVTIT